MWLSTEAFSSGYQSFYTSVTINDNHNNSEIYTFIVVFCCTFQFILDKKDLTALFGQLDMNFFEFCPKDGVEFKLLC